MKITRDQVQKLANSLGTNVSGQYIASRLGIKW